MKNWAVSYYRDRLSPSSQAQYDAILRGWERSQSRIALPLFPPAADSSADIVSAAAMDHPELFHPNYFEFRQETRRLMAAPVQNALVFDYFMEGAQLADARQALARWRSAIIGQVCPDTPRLNRVWQIYDYLARAVRYQDQNRLLSNTVLGCLPRYGGAAVCEGIAKAMKLLCDDLDIPCLVACGEYAALGGQGGLHAWNMVELRPGLLRHVDVTAELNSAQFHGIANRDSFLMSDEQARRRGYRWERKGLPTAG